jgi:hypothetical protein
MIIGQFRWRNWEIEADRAVGDLAGETVWLKRTSDNTGIATFRNGTLIMSSNAPSDDTAEIELRAAFEGFRATLSRRVP